LSLPSEWIVLTDSQARSVKTDCSPRFIGAGKYSEGGTDKLRQGRQHLAALREAAEALLSPANRADLDNLARRSIGFCVTVSSRDRNEPSWLDKFKARVRAWIARHLEKIFGRVEFPNQLAMQSRGHLWRW